MKIIAVITLFCFSGFTCAETLQQVKLVFRFDKCILVGSNLKKPSQAIKTFDVPAHVVTCIGGKGKLYRCNFDIGKKKSSGNYSLVVESTGDHILVEKGSLNIFHFKDGRATFHVRSLQSSFSGFKFCSGVVSETYL